MASYALGATGTAFLGRIAIGRAGDGTNSALTVTLGARSARPETAAGTPDGAGAAAEAITGIEILPFGAGCGAKAKAGTTGVGTGADS